MKILNSSSNQVFDTDNPNFQEYFTGTKPSVLDSLHQHHRISDYEFLRKYFSKNHSVFYEFSNTIYYVLTGKEVDA